EHRGPVGARRCRGPGPRRADRPYRAGRPDRAAPRGPAGRGGIHTSRVENPAQGGLGQQGCPPAHWAGESVDRDRGRRGGVRLRRAVGHVRRGRRGADHAVDPLPRRHTDRVGRLDDPRDPAGVDVWRVALPAGLFGSGFAVAGAEMSDHVNGHILMLITAAMLLWSGLATIRKRRAADLAAADPLPVPVGGPADAEGEVIAIHAALTPAVGAVGAGESESKRPIVVVAGIAAAAGLLAGLLGVGGGVLLVPAFTGILRIPPKRAVASSLVAVAMFSIPAMVTHTLLGHINWAYALPLVAGVVPGAQVGAKFTLQRTEAQLRFLMGLFFVILAIVYGTRELLAL